MSVGPSVCPSVGDMVSGAQLKFALELQFHVHVDCGHRQEPIDFQRCHFQNGRLVAILDISVSGLCRWHGFRNVTRVCFGISVLNFMCMSLVAMG